MKNDKGLFARLFAALAEDELQQFCVILIPNT